MTETNLGEQPPTLLRRHAAGTDSARGVLFTVLGELVLPTGGEAWTSAFIDVFGRLGVEEKAARQALMRTAADNWLSSGAGRAAHGLAAHADRRAAAAGRHRTHLRLHRGRRGLGRPLDDRDRAHPGDRTRRPARASGRGCAGPGSAASCPEYG